MQARGTTASRDRSRKEEEEQKKKGGKKTKPKMTAAKAAAQQSRTNIRTNTTRAELTDGPSSKPKTTGSTTTKPKTTSGKKPTTSSTTTKQTGSLLQDNRLTPTSIIDRALTPSYQTTQRSSTTTKPTTTSTQRGHSYSTQQSVGTKGTPVKTVRQVPGTKSSDKEESTTSRFLTNLGNYIKVKNRNDTQKVVDFLRSSLQTAANASTQQAVRNADAVQQTGKFIGSAAQSTAEATRQSATDAGRMAQAQSVHAKNRAEIRELEKKRAQLIQIRDDMKAEEMMDGLPQSVIDWLDRYNFEKSNLEDATNQRRRENAINNTQQLSSDLEQDIESRIAKIKDQLRHLGVDNYEELATWRKRITDKMTAEELEQTAYALAQEHPALGTAANVLLSPGAMIQSAGGVIKDAMESLGRTVTGQEPLEKGINTYGSEWLSSRVKNAVNQGVKSTFEDTGIGKKMKDTLYDTLISTVDSVVASSMPLGEVLLGAGAMGDTYMQVAENGGSDGPALLSGLLAGTAEGFFEHYSIGLLRLMKELPLNFLKEGFLKTVGKMGLNALKSVGTNAWEEAATEAANILNDYWVNGGNSDFYRAYDYAKTEKHYSEGKAIKYAISEMCGRVGTATFSGGLMGFGLGGVGSAASVATQRSAYNQRGKQIAADSTARGNIIAGAEDLRTNGALDEKTKTKVDKLIDEAKAAPGVATAETEAKPDSESKTDGKQDSKTDGKKNKKNSNKRSAAQRKSDRATAILEQIVVEETDKETAGIVAQAAQGRLKALGETTNTERVGRAIGEIVTNTSTSEKAQQAAQQTIQNSRYGVRVLNELTDTEGQTSNEWIGAMLEEISALEDRRYNGKGAETADSSTTSTRAKGRAAGSTASGKSGGASGEQSMSAEGQEAAEVYFENQLRKGEVRSSDEQMYKKEFSDIYRWSRDGQITEKKQAVAESTITGLSEKAKAAAFEAGRQAARAEAAAEQSDAEAEGTATSPVSAQERAATLPAGGEGKSAAGVQERGTQAKPQIVTGIEGVTDEGEVIMRTKDGGTVALSDAGLDNESTWIATQAAKYEGEAADAFFQGFAPGVSPSSYNDAFSTFYNAGQLGGQTFQQFRQTADAKVLMRYLGEATAQKAFEAGRASSNRGGEGGATSPVSAQERAATLPASGEGKKAAGVQKKRGSKREGSYSSKAAMDEAVDTMLQALSKKTGIDVERLPAVFAGKMEANGKFVRGVVKILLSENAQNEFATLFHELTHAGAAFNVEGYAGYLGAILQWYQQNYGHNSLKERLQEIYRVYHANDASFTESKAVEEFVCEATAGLFSTEEGAQDFVEWLQNESGYTETQQKTVLQRIAELFQKIVDRIKELIGEGNLSDIAADFAQAQADEAARLRQMFLDVLDGMEVAEGATEEQREAKYAIKYPNFSEQQEKENKRILAKMDPVYHVPAERLRKTGKKVTEIYIEFFESLGNNIYTEQFGDIAITRKSIKDDDNHGKFSPKVAAVEAVPTVLNKGIVIFQNQPQNTSHEILVVAAPITIGDDSYYMGVMLLRDQNGQRLRMHGVVIEKETIEMLTASGSTTPTLNKNERLSISTILLDALKVKTKMILDGDLEAKNSLRLAEGTPSVASGDSSLKEGAKAGGLERAEYTDGPNGEVLKNGRVQVARISTFAATNNREIIRRLQAQSDFFKGMTVGDALAQFRYAEQNGLVERGDGWLAVYHDANLEGVESEHQTKAEQMDKLRLSLGLEAQNSRLAQQNEQLRELNRRQAAQIREMQRTLTQSGVETFADTKKVATFAGKIVRDYKVPAAQRGQIARQLEDLYHDMANNVTSRDVTQTRADELAEQILKQSAYNQPQVSEYSQAVIDDVKSVGIRLSDAQKAEAAYRYGSYGAFYRASMGAMKIRNDGVPLDQRWAELAEAHPAIFDAEASEADQALLLFEAVRSLQNDYIDDNGFDYDEAKEFLSGQILDGFRDAVGTAQQLTMKQKMAIRKELDARQATIDKLKQQIKQEREQAKVQAKADVRQAKTEAAAALRAEFDDKFLANRARYEQRVQNIAETQQKAGQRRYIERRITRFTRMLQPTRGNDNIVQPLRELVGRVLDIIPQSGRAQIKRESWTELELEYRNLRDNNEDFAGIYGEVFATIGQDIEQMKEETSGKRFSQLTLRQLQTMARIMDHINAMVKNEQEVIIDGRKQQAAAAGRQAIAEAEQNAKDVRFKGETWGKMKTTFDVNNQKPVYFFRRVGGVMQQLFNDTRKGQSEWAERVQAGKDFFTQTFEKYHAHDWMQNEQTFTLHDWQGREREDVTLTVGQMLSLYATAKREGVVARKYGEKQTQHLLGGGFCFEDQWKKKGVGKNTRYEMDGDAHQLTVDDVMAIAEALTDEQRAYADEMVHYLSTDMAKLGNDVTMQLYGFNMFNEQYYFPLNVKKTFLFQKFGEQGENMLQAMGFTNATKYNANTPIILSAFDDVWAGHVERMSAYSSLVIPINSMQRVWNYKESTGEIGHEQQKTMAQTFTQSYGKDYASYFQQFMKDINGDVVGDKREEALNALIGKFKKNAVFASMSVTIQQPSAVMRAMAYIDPKYFAATSGCNRSKMYAEAKQYSGLAIIKEMGGFDVGSGKTAVDWMMEAETTPRTAKEAAKAFFNPKDSSFRDEAFGWTAGKADEITWAHIWAAAKKQVQVQEHLSGEALNERTAEVFNDVIDLTQVYDSVFSRSANMRSKGGLWKAVTAFMGEPTTTINMLQDAVLQKDAKFGAKIFAACFAQILFNAALKSIITAARDDDEDKNPFEKYVAQLFGNFLDDLNPAGMVPFFRDILSITKGFTVGRSDLEIVQEMVDAVKNFTEKIGARDYHFTMDDWTQLAGAVGPFIDYPIKNLLRDAKGLRNTIEGFKNGTAPTMSGAWYAIKQELAPVAKNFGLASEESNAQELYAAFLAEDDEMYARIAQKYKSSAAIKNAIVGQIKTAYEGGEITIEEAQQILQRLPAYNEQKAKQETRHWVDNWKEEQMAMGEEDQVEKTGGYFTLDTMRQDKEEADENGYQVTTDWTFLQNAVKDQDPKAIKEEIAQLKKYGKSEKDIQENLRRYIKNNDKDVQAAGEKYKNGDVSVMSEGALGMIASRYGIDNTEVMRMIRTEAGVTNSPIEGTIWQLNDLKRAIESGSNMTYDIKWSIVKAKEQQFADKKNPTSAAFESLRSSLTSYFKPKYQAADAAGREKIRQQLKAAACWPNEAMLNSTLRKWAQG